MSEDVRELSEPVDATDLYPPKEFIKSEHLRGRELTLPVVKIERREIKDQKGDWKIEGLVTFGLTPELIDEKCPAKLSLNATNRKALEAMFGTFDIQKTWIGKRVTLHTDTDYRPDIRRRGPCIRIKGSPDISEPVTYVIVKKTAQGISSATHEAVPTEAPVDVFGSLKAAIQSAETEAALSELIPRLQEIPAKKLLPAEQYRQLQGVYKARLGELKTETINT